jgi:LPXTG-site transpeptidase (sortase) family protein
LKVPRVVDDAHRARLWLLAERSAWAIAVVCLSVWSAVQIDREIGRRRAMERFAASPPSAARAVPAALVTPDQSLWSPERIVAWHTALKDPGPVPLAILRIPRVHIEVPVLPGTDEITLNRGAGHIEDTARPGTDGNSGIAAHRDGFFRGLKDVAAGDAIELQTSGKTEIYRIERIWIVDPEDVSVLDPTPARSLTLVTCYPFYFIGSAPRRYIVRAVLAGGAPTPQNGPGRE